MAAAVYRNKVTDAPARCDLYLVAGLSHQPLCPQSPRKEKSKTIQ